MDKVLVEWVNPPTEQKPFCPWCFNYQVDGHRQDCGRIIAVDAIQAAEEKIDELRSLAAEPKEVA